MQIINDNGLRILVPDKGYNLVNKLTGKTSKRFYLSKLDNESNYTEVADPDFKYEDDESMNIVLQTIDELIRVLSPVIASMPLTLETNETDPQFSFMRVIAKFYEEMVKRGLKLEKDVPEPYRSYMDIQ